MAMARIRLDFLDFRAAVGITMAPSIALELTAFGGVPRPILSNTESWGRYLGTDFESISTG